MLELYDRYVDYKVMFRQVHIFKRIQRVKEYTWGCAGHCDTDVLRKVQGRIA